MINLAIIPPTHRISLVSIDRAGYSPNDELVHFAAVTSTLFELSDEEFIDVLRRAQQLRMQAIDYWSMPADFFSWRDTPTPSSLVLERKLRALAIELVERDQAADILGGVLLLFSVRALNYRATLPGAQIMWQAIADRAMSINRARAIKDIAGLFLPEGDLLDGTSLEWSSEKGS